MSVLLAFSGSGIHFDGVNGLWARQGKALADIMFLWYTRHDSSYVLSRNVCVYARIVLFASMLYIELISLPNRKGILHNITSPGCDLFLSLFSIISELSSLNYNHRFNYFQVDITPCWHSSKST